MRHYKSLLRFLPPTFLGWISGLIMVQAQPVLTVGPTTEVLEFSPSIQFIFSEPMDSNGIDVTWTGNIDEAKFQCSWLQSFPGIPVIILQCSYQGGLPEGVEITYTLNAGNSDVMKSAFGQTLAEVSGTFITPGEGDGGGGVIPPIEPDCEDDPVNTNEKGTMYLFRNLEFLQQGPALSNHPSRPHGVMGGLSVSEALGNANLSDLTLIKPDGAREDLIHFDHPLGSDLYFLSTQPLPNIAPPVFGDISTLQETYSTGRYQFAGQSDLGNLLVTLQMGDLNAVSDPIFTGLGSIPHGALDQAWNLHWNGATPLNANTHVSVAIEDLDGNRVFHAPDPCKNIELAPSATSIEIPAGILMSGQNYRVTLNFFTLTDQGETQSFGIQQYAGVGKRTEMLIGPEDSNTQPVELSFTNISRDSSGVVTLTISGTLNASIPSVLIEESTDGQLWLPSSEVTFEMLQQGGGSAELVDITARFLSMKIYRIAS